MVIKGITKELKSKAIVPSVVEATIVPSVVEGFYVYILRTSANTLYVGQTNNLEKRMSEHKAKTIKSSKYVRSFASFKLVYSETFPTRSQALKREYELKQFSKAKKEALVKGDSKVL
jgi:predicted GIY-YIG superfamily endonuclease